VQRFDDRQARKQDHFDNRQARRAAAEAEWRAARAQAADQARGNRARHGAASKSARRWRAEAHDSTDARRDERWRKAARRRGLLPEGDSGAEGSDSSGPLIPQRVADEAAERSITRENADAELRRLRWEIENDR
jgi:hypothetical protein